VSSIGLAQAGNMVIPYVYKTATPVSIDADLKEWNFCYPIDFNRQSIPDSSRAWAWVPATDTVCSGRLFMMYDDAYFYFAANVRDETPGHFSDAGWAATAIEFYFSNKNLGPNAVAGDHEGLLDTTTSYDIQLNISFSERLDSVVINKYGAENRVLNWNRNNVKYRIWDAGDGYILEGRIPWDSLKSSVTGNSPKFVPGSRVAATWSLFHMDATELSGAFSGYQYSKNPPYVGPTNWQVITVKDVPLTQVGIITGVDEVPGPLPSSFTLSPAYPNPFNPSTNIQYTLNAAGRTSLRVYNLLGQLVATLVNDTYQAAGTYRLQVDMHSASSGVYFYVLEQGRNRLSQKMLLVK
jgi:hypothetical protein